MSQEAPYVARGLIALYILHAVTVVALGADIVELTSIGTFAIPRLLVALTGSILLLVATLLEYRGRSQNWSLYVALIGFGLFSLYLSRSNIVLAVLTPAILAGFLGLFATFMVGRARTAIAMGIGVLSIVATWTLLVTNPPSHQIADGTYQLGVMYWQGKQVPKNRELAITNLERSAALGSPAAASLLGQIHMSGIDGVRNPDVAVALWKRSAADGEPVSQYLLGLVYAGKLPGAVTEPVLAYAWLNLAAAKGVKEAEQAREELRAMMNSTQVNEAERLSVDWRPGREMRM